MSIWILFTLLAIITRATYGVLTKITSSVSKQIHYSSNSFFLTSTNAMLALIISPLLGGVEFRLSIFSTAFIIAMIAALVGNLIYFAAIKNLSSSNSQILFSSILPFNTVLGIIILNQKLTLINVLGIILLMLAIFMACYVREDINKRAAMLMIVSAACFAVMQIFTAKVSNTMTSASYVFYSSIFFSVGAFLIYFKNITVDFGHVTNKYFGTILLTGLFSTANLIFAFLAYKNSPEPTKVAMLLTSQVILAVLLSALLLHERSHLPRKLTASVIAFIGAVMIKN